MNYGGHSKEHTLASTVLLMILLGSNAPHCPAQHLEDQGPWAFTTELCTWVIYSLIEQPSPAAEEAHD